MKKIFSLTEVIKKLIKIRKNKKKIVLCHGVFDLVHYGHILHFKSAKKFGDFLIVSVTDDKFIKKGPGKPLFNLETRMQYLSSIDIIDAVIPSYSSSAVENLDIVKPNFYVKGSDYKRLKNDKSKKIILEKKILERNNGKIKFTKDQTYSSTALINSTGLIFNEEQRNFLNLLKKKFGGNYILEQISCFNNLSVLILGELIFDQYIYGNVIGKSGKEPHLVFEKKESEYYVGGGGAIARHLQSFVKNVLYFSNFGKEAELAQPLKKSFNNNVNFLNLIPYKNFKSIIKTRFVDYNSSYKMFGTYQLAEKPPVNYIKEYLKIIKKHKIKKDILIIGDYGHNLIPKEISKYLINNFKFTSVNCQVNSSSIGSHNISKYKGANALIINEYELRFEERDQKNEIEYIIKNFSKKVNIKNIILTRGKQGSIYFSNNKFYYCPAFAISSIDKVGAGDAMLSLCTLAIFKKMDPHIVLLIGSLAAAISVQSLGNKKHVDYYELTTMLEYVLK